MKFLLTNVTVMAMDSGGTILPDGYIAVDGEKIQAVGAMKNLDLRNYPE